VIDAMRAECPSINLEAEHRKFSDYWRSKTGAGSAKRDWPATWRNWIRTAAERQPNRPSPGRRRPNDDIDWDAAMQRAHQRDQETLT
jgi:hypothetical protein